MVVSWRLRAGDKDILCVAAVFFAPALVIAAGDAGLAPKALDVIQPCLQVAHAAHAALALARHQRAASPQLPADDVSIELGPVVIADGPPTSLVLHLEPARSVRSPPHESNRRGALVIWQGWTRWW